MARFAWVVLAGFVLGTPAVPLGLSLSLPPVVALLAVLLGAAFCLLFAVFAMERIRAGWQAWRADRGAVAGTSWASEWTSKRLSGKTGHRARRVIHRYGAAGFGVVGPVLFGTWGSALLGTALGMPRWRLLGWLMAGVSLWCTVLLFASDAVLGAFGFG